MSTSKTSNSGFKKYKGVDPREPLLPRAVHLTKKQLEVDDDDIDDDEHIHDYLGLNRNVALTLAFTALSSAGRSLWSQNVLSTFVFLLMKGHAQSVGMITSIMGMVQLLSSFPTGFLADHYRRDSMLKVAAVVGMVAAVITLGALKQESEHLLRLALAAWGIFWGITNTALTALFADSVPKGARPKYFTQRAVLLNMGNIVGPIVAILLFSRLGNKWSLKDCAIVMAVGQVVCIASQMLLCFLNDDDTTAEEEDEDTDTSTDETAAHDESDDDSDSEGMMASCLHNNNNNNSKSHHHHHQHSSSSDASFSSCSFFSKRRATPVLVAMSDVAGGLAAGMSIRYFPIFFADNLKLSPVAVQWLYIISPVLQSLLMKGAYRLSQRYGRCRVAVLHKWTGILFMLLMVLSYQRNCSISTICMLYMIRTAFMNSTSALTKSVLMDSVPRSERAKWSALESVNMFSWSGSAAIGGLLVAYKGVLFNFCITAGIQFLASLPLVVLCWDEHGDDQEAAAVKLLDSDDSLSLSSDDNDDDDDEMSMVENAYPNYTDEPNKSPATKTSRLVKKTLTI